MAGGTSSFRLMGFEGTLRLLVYEEGGASFLTPPSIS